MLIPWTRTRKITVSQDDPKRDPYHMDHLDHITFLPITSKLMDGVTPDLPVCSSAQETPYLMWLLRSIRR